MSSCMTHFPGVAFQQVKHPAAGVDIHFIEGQDFYFGWCFPADSFDKGVGEQEGIASFPAGASV